MDAAAMNLILENLKEMAATLSSQDVKELQQTKDNLDRYVEDITSKIPQQSREIALGEFKKCRVCAREWIGVYCDPTYRVDIKADILKEEAMEFFFTMDEKIVAVQKNFFMLGMIDEILTPSEPFSDRKREAKIAKSKIRILARYNGLTATCKTRPDPVTGAINDDHFWYFGDDRNFLQSSEDGLTDKEAIEYLLR